MNDEITNLRNLGDQLAQAIRTGRFDDALDAWENYRSKEADGIVADLINRATTWLDSSDDYRLDMAAANKIQQLYDQLKQCRAERDTYSRLYDEVRTSMDEYDSAYARIETLQDAGDSLAIAYRTLRWFDISYDTPLQCWEDIRGD